MPHTRDLRKNPGIKTSYLPLPTTLEGQQSYCITIPDGLENKRVLIELLQIATWWFNWSRSDGIEGKQTADAWRDALNLPELKMCCCPEPTNRRYNESGQLEVSYDNGLTWDTDNSLDDRYSGATSPPITGEDGSEKRCIGASAARQFAQQNLIDDLVAGANYADLNAALVALVFVLGVTGIGILIAAAAAAIFIAGVSAVQAAFTSTVWDDFECILYCNIENDASYNETGWNNVKSDILAQFTGVVQTILWNWVNSIGLVGLTNAARSGFELAPDCDACDCPGCLSLDHWIYGNVTSSTDNLDGTWTFEVTSSPAPDLTEAIRWQRTTGSCEFISFVITDGIGDPGWYQSFDTDPPDDCLPKSGFTAGCTRCVQYIQDDFLTTPFHAIITIGAECP